MVAVRLARLAVPDLKVKVAVPSVPVVAVEALTTPVSVDKDTTMPESAAFEPFSAVTVIVVDAVLSDGTDVAEAESSSVAARVVAVAPLPGAVPPLPQAVSAANKAASVNFVENL